MVNPQLHEIDFKELLTQHLQKMADNEKLLGNLFLAASRDFLKVLNGELV